MKSVKPYLNCEYEDICVAFCFFKPVDYIKPVQNLKIFLDDLNLSHIPYFSIELLYNNQLSIIPNASLTVKSDTVVFSKENLWNLIEKYIPDKYSKIIFLDADIRFTNPNWINLSREVMNNYDLIQPMEYCYRSIENKSSFYNIDNDNIRSSIAKGIFYKENINLGYHYPGFSIGIDRNFYHKIGGFFDKGFNGCGDSLFWGCFGLYNQYIEQISQTFTEYQSYKENIKNTIIDNNCVSYVSNNIALHLKHGLDKNRKYSERHIYLPTNYKTFYNNDGVLEIISFDKDKKDLIQYWIDRKEDE